MNKDQWKKLAMGNGLLSVAMLLGFVQIGWMVFAMISIFCLMMYSRADAMEKEEEEKK